MTYPFYLSISQACAYVRGGCPFCHLVSVRTLYHAFWETYPSYLFSLSFSIAYWSSNMSPYIIRRTTFPMLLFRYLHQKQLDQKSIWTTPSAISRLSIPPIEFSLFIHMFCRHRACNNDVILRSLRSINANYIHLFCNLHSRCLVAISSMFPKFMVKGAFLIFSWLILDEPSYRAAELETTAAEAQIEAPTSQIAREIEENAEHVHDAAKDAADVARVSVVKLAA